MILEIIELSIRLVEICVNDRISKPDRRYDFARDITVLDSFASCNKFHK